MAASAASLCRRRPPRLGGARPAGGRPGCAQRDGSRCQRRGTPPRCLPQGATPPAGSPAPPATWPPPGRCTGGNAPAGRPAGRAARRGARPARSAAGARWTSAGGCSCWPGAAGTPAQREALAHYTALRRDTARIRHAGGQRVHARHATPVHVGMRGFADAGTAWRLPGRYLSRTSRHRFRVRRFRARLLRHRAAQLVESRLRITGHAAQPGHWGAGGGWAASLSVSSAANMKPTALHHLHDNGNPDTPGSRLDCLLEIGAACHHPTHQCIRVQELVCVCSTYTI